MEQEDRFGGVDLTKLKQLLEETQRHLHEERKLVFFNFYPSNAFLRRRRKKALLRVNDRGGGWRMCILALCRACLCACFVRVCVLLYQINHARNSLYEHSLYSVYTAYIERYVVVQFIYMHISNKFA